MFDFIDLQYHWLTPCKRTVGIGGEEVHTIHTTADVGRLTTHASVSARRHAVVVQDLIVVTATDGVKSALSRTDRLGEELMSTAMGTGTLVIISTYQFFWHD